MNSLRRIRIIIVSTLNDELHHKSVYILAACSVLFVLLLRGCFEGDMVVNGEKVDGVTVGWHASLIAFHLIAGAGIIVGILLGMRVLRQEKTAGGTAAMLAGPVRRIEYLMGKVTGIWIVAYGLTFILHLTVYLIMLFYTGGRIVLFMPASLLISLNILFAVVLVMLLSQLLPDIVAALVGGVVWMIGYFSDTFYMASQNEMVKNVMRQMNHAEQPLALWRIIWPKITALQFFAVARIKDVEFHMPGPVHPIINVSGFLVLGFLLLWWQFSREEIR
jgi:ABC-type transport system involved in multi-copper enzyme maturation permease subunit